MKRFLAMKSRAVVAVVSMAMFIVQLDAAVLAIALPDIARDFGRPVVSLSLAITIYLTMLVAVLPISGWMADRFGARRIFIWSTLGFALFSLACALAPTFWWFILARACQGVCASLMSPVARLILLRRTSKAEMVDALAISAMPMLVAPTLGPSIGGLIVDQAGWQYIFLLNIPVALALIAGIVLRVPPEEPLPARKLDFAGALLLSGALIALLTGADRLASHVTAPLPWALLVTGAVLGWLTWRHLRHHPHPIVELDALKIDAFRTTAIGAGAMIRIPGRAILFALPLMFQLGFGMSAFAAGLMLMLLNGGDLIVKPFVRPAFDHFGFGGAVVLGSVLGLAGIALLAMAGTGSAWIVAASVALLAAGISRSFVFTGMASLTFTSLGTRDMTSGNVLASISMQLFNALAVTGTALVLGLSAQFSGRTEPALFDFRVALVVMVLFGIAATLALRRQLPHDLAEVHAEESI